MVSQIFSLGSQIQTFVQLFDRTYKFLTNNLFKILDVYGEKRIDVFFLENMDVDSGM